MSLSQRVARSTKFTLAATFIGVLIQIAIMVVLLRALTPADYGVYAAALATVAITVALVTGTIERTLMVAASQIDLAGRSIPLFFLAVLCAIIVLLAVVGLRAAEVIHLQLEVVAGLLLGQLINGFGAVARVQLRREFKFGWITASELLGQFWGTGVAAIVLAQLGYGYYALVAGAIIQGAVVMAIMQAATPTSLVWPIRWHETITICKMALSLARSSSLEAVRVHLPVFIIGRLGETALGLFNRSYSLIHLPVEVLSGAVNRVAVSALVQVSGERAQLSKVTEMYVLAVTGLTFPIAAGIAGAAGHFTRVTMGEKWLEVIPLVPWVALAAGTLVASRCFGILGETLQAFHEKARLEFTSIIVLGIAIMGGTLIGLEASVIGLGIAGIFYWIMNIVLASKLLSLSKRAVVSWHIPALTAAGLCFTWCKLAAEVGVSLPTSAVFAGQVAGCFFLTLAYYCLARRDLVVALWQSIRPVRSQ